MPDDLMSNVKEAIEQTLIRRGFKDVGATVMVEVVEGSMN
jgi:hypothetical protein